MGWTLMIVWSTRLCDQNVFNGMGNIAKDGGKQNCNQTHIQFQIFLNCCLWPKT
jgi:hypothetical protein